MIRPVLSSLVVKGVYNFTRWVIVVFQFLLMVPDTKLLQSVVCTGMALDRWGLATYNRPTRSSLYKTIVFIKLRCLCARAPKT
ncbi:hypothetical protein F0T03_00515 [Yersinia canariae]|uniref:Uncharacterized protein n=1 Tax=Yersinia canariae TaxID=2607663 RepID=A0A857ETN8_9GAMM|nr:hypothetical protein F0T03_00515 [Yersinia canariae]